MYIGQIEFTEDELIKERRNAYGELLEKKRKSDDRRIKDVTLEINNMLSRKGEKTVTEVLVRHWENGIKPLKEKYFSIITEVYGVKFELKMHSLSEKRANCLREIINRSSIRLALIISDLQWDLVSFDNKPGILKPGGGAYHLSYAALLNNFLPIVVSTVADDKLGIKIINDLNELGGKIKEEQNESKLSDILKGAITSLIVRKPGKETPIHGIRYNACIKEPSRNVENEGHINDIDISKINQSIYISGVCENDVIFFQTYQLFRKILAHRRLPDGLRKSDFINDLMDSLLMGGKKRRPKVVVELTPPDLLHDHLSFGELEFILKTDVLVVELRTILKFLDKNKESYNEEIKNAITKDLLKIEKDGFIENINPTYYSELKNIFLKLEEGKTLIIRFGEYLKSQKILIRSNDNKTGFKDDNMASNNDGKKIDLEKEYGLEIPKLGTSEIVTFRYLNENR